MTESPIERAHAVAIQIRGRLVQLSERGDVSVEDFRAFLGDLAQAMDGLCESLKQLIEVEREHYGEKTLGTNLHLPNLRALAAWLRAKDADSTGADDEAAGAIDYAVNRLEIWLTNE